MKIGYLMQEGAPEMRQRPLSGPAIHVTHVIQELTALGHEVRLLARWHGRLHYSDDLHTFHPLPPSPLDSGLRRLLERIIRRTQFTLRLPYAALFDSLRFAHACRHALADRDIFYERMGWVGYGGAIASRQLGVPLILEVNGDHLDELASLGIAPKGGQRRLSMWLMQRAIAQAAHVVTAGEGWRDKFLQRWAIDPQKVTSIENGSEMVEMLSRQQLAAFAPAASPDAPLTIAFIGSFYPWQGIGGLLTAFAEVAQQHPQVRLLLIGKGPDEAALRAQAAASGIAAQVTFTGHLSPDEMAAALATAEIGVSPYCGRHEFSGLKLLDYKAAGLAIVASGQDGQPAILEDGRTALIVPPCDETAIGHALRQLVVDAPLRRKLGQQARLEAEEWHSWRQTAVHIQTLMQQITQEKPHDGNHQHSQKLART